MRFGDEDETVEPLSPFGTVWICGGGSWPPPALAAMRGGKDRVPGYVTPALLFEPCQCQQTAEEVGHHPRGRRRLRCLPHRTDQGVRGSFTGGEDLPYGNTRPR